MARFDTLLHSLNRGVVDRDKMHRVDLEGLRLAAEDQTNLIPTVVGPAIFRQGTEYLGGTKSNAECELLPFIAGDDASYMLELTNLSLRVWDDDAPITRPDVISTVTNGDFAAGAGWTLSAADGQTSIVASGGLQLRAFGKGAIAYGKQQVSTSSPGVLHALRIEVTSGPVTLRVGSTDGGEEYIPEASLGVGLHSLAFVPAGSYWIKFSHTRDYAIFINECQVEAAGVMDIATPYTLAQTALVRYTQSIDVMYLACEGVRRMKIERRGKVGTAAEGQSWSIVNYEPEDGQFGIGPTADLSLAPSGTTSAVTLTASLPFFDPGHVGALFQLYHDGQFVDEYLAGLNQFTSTIMVTGVNETDYNDRLWSLDISGTWVGTLVVERSFDGEDFEFHEFRRETGASTINITANATYANDDNEDNAVIWYRVKFKAYTSGAARIQINYPGGGGSGIARVLSVTNSTTAVVRVLTPFKGLAATKDWKEGQWSDYRGQPAGVTFDEGRLVWVGSDQIAASVSDAFESFDVDYVGDAGPLIRSIALGARNEARWAISMAALIVGCDGRVAQAQASVLGDIKTPDNFGVHNVPARGGVAKIAPVVIDDDRAIYVHQSRKKLFELSYAGDRGRYLATEFSKLTTELFANGIRSMALQSLPDQRIWVTTDNGDAVMIVYEPEHKVVAFIPIETADGDIIESVCVLPNGDDDDRLYVSVKRTVGGVPLRYVEKLALDSEAKPGDVTKCMDSHVEFAALPSGYVSTLGHLIGRTVVAWADGDSVDDADGNAQTFVVDADGGVGLPFAATAGGCVGLPYEGRFKSARLEYGVDGTTIKAKKQIGGAGLLLSDYIRSGVKVGTNFDDMDTAGGTLQSLPMIGPDGDQADEIVVGVPDDEDLIAISGQLKYDTRICIKVASPKPATIRAIVLGIETK